MTLLHSNQDFTHTADFTNNAHFTNTVAFTEKPKQSQSNPLVSSVNAPYAGRKWMYLIANQINFATRCDDAIRVKKPSNQHLFEWMERIVLAGQCAVLFVENLNLDDVRTQYMKSLCEHHHVTLVNLTVDCPAPKNVLLGPWH
jgi:hypothetical protein